MARHSLPTLESIEMGILALLGSSGPKQSAYIVQGLADGFEETISDSFIGLVSQSLKRLRSSNLIVKKKGWRLAPNVDIISALANKFYDQECELTIDSSDQSEIVDREEIAKHILELCATNPDGVTAQQGYDYIHKICQISTPQTSNWQNKVRWVVRSLRQQGKLYRTGHYTGDTGVKENLNSNFGIWKLTPSGGGSKNAISDGRLQTVTDEFGGLVVAFTDYPTQCNYLFTADNGKTVVNVMIDVNKHSDYSLLVNISMNGGTFRTLNDGTYRPIEDCIGAMEGFFHTRKWWEESKPLLLEWMKDTSGM